MEEQLTIEKYCLERKLEEAEKLVQELKSIIEKQQEEYVTLKRYTENLLKQING